MTNPHLDQARAWARDNIDDFYEGESAYAVCEVIQSLPDHWIDAEELRELVVKYEAFAEDAEPEGEKGRIRAALYRNFVGVLEALLPTPSLPTLADMTLGEREWCQWMQARDSLGKLCVIERITDTARLLYEDGYSCEAQLYKVTPLPDLPRLKWPGNEPEETSHD